MRAVGLKILKNKLSEYVRLAENGETILITDRDRVVAEIKPPDAMRSLHVADAQLAELVRHGVVTPPLVAGGEIPRKPVMSLRELLDELRDARRDR